MVVKEHDQFSDGTSMLAWCRSIVRIEVLIAKERYHRDRSLIERVLDDAIDGAFQECRQARNRMEKDRRRDALGQCLAQLSDRGRLVLKARMADELGFSQIGKRLEMSIEAVRKALLRSKKQLRACVEANLRTIR